MIYLYLKFTKVLLLKIKNLKILMNTINDSCPLSITIGIKMNTMI